MSVEESVNAVGYARNSAGNEVWPYDAGDEVKVEGYDDEELSAASARLYRGVAARLNYIAPDRPDLGFAVKEAARSMSKPKVGDMQRLKKITVTIAVVTTLNWFTAWNGAASRFALPR